MKFAKSLLAVYESWLSKPAQERVDLRARISVDASRTDRELFSAMQLDDVWVDSKIHEVIFYLWQSKKCKILVCILYKK